MDGAVQHDAHELNRLLIDALQMSLKNCKNNEAHSLIQRLYQGKLSNEIRCLKCEQYSRRDEDYYDLLMQVTGCDDLVSSLRQYTTAEMMEGDNMYDCSVCKSKQRATRCVRLATLPPILTFSCQRFDIDRTTWQRVKVTSKNEFPLVLNMSNYVGKSQFTGVTKLEKESENKFVEEQHNHMLWLDDVIASSKKLACVYYDVFLKSEYASCKNQSQTRATDGIEFPEIVQFLQSECMTSSDWKGIEMQLNVSKSGSALNWTEEDQRNVYDLQAVLMHRGTAYSGHYFAYIRDFMGEGTWNASCASYSGDKQRPLKASKKNLKKVSNVDRNVVPACPPLGGEVDVDDAAYARQLQESLYEDLETSDRVKKEKDDVWETVESHKKRIPPSDHASMRTASAKPTIEAIEKQSACTKEQCIEFISNVFLSKYFGQFYEFNDSIVSAMPIANLSKAFMGKDCAYMLIYRSRSAPKALQCAGSAGGDNGSEQRYPVVYFSSTQEPAIASAQEAVKVEVEMADVAIHLKQPYPFSVPPTPPKHWIEAVVNPRNQVLAGIRKDFLDAQTALKLHLYVPEDFVYGYPVLKEKYVERDPDVGQHPDATCSTQWWVNVSSADNLEQIKEKICAHFQQLLVDADSPLNGKREGYSKAARIIDIVSKSSTVEGKKKPKVWNNTSTDCINSYWQVLYPVGGSFILTTDCWNAGNLDRGRSVPAWCENWNKMKSSIENWVKNPCKDSNERHLLLWDGLDSSIERANTAVLSSTNTSRAVSIVNLAKCPLQRCNVLDWLHIPIACSISVLHTSLSPAEKVRSHIFTQCEALERVVYTHLDLLYHEDTKHSKVPIYFFHDFSLDFACKAIMAMLNLTEASNVAISVLSRTANVGHGKLEMVAIPVWMRGQLVFNVDAEPRHADKDGFTAVPTSKGQRKGKSGVIHGHMKNGGRGSGRGSDNSVTPVHNSVAAHSRDHQANFVLKDLPSFEFLVETQPQCGYLASVEAVKRRTYWTIYVDVPMPAVEVILRQWQHAQQQALELEGSSRSKSAGSETKSSIVDPPKISYALSVSKSSTIYDLKVKCITHILKQFIPEDYQRASAYMESHFVSKVKLRNEHVYVEAQCSNDNVRAGIVLSEEYFCLEDSKCKLLYSLKNDCTLILDNAFIESNPNLSCSSALHPGENCGTADADKAICQESVNVKFILPTDGQRAWILRECETRDQPGSSPQTDTSGDKLHVNPVEVLLNKLESLAAPAESLEKNRAKVLEVPLTWMEANSIASECELPSQVAPGSGHEEPLTLKEFKFNVLMQYLRLCRLELNMDVSVSKKEMREWVDLLPYLRLRHTNWLQEPTPDMIVEQEYELIGTRSQNRHTDVNGATAGIGKRDSIREDIAKLCRLSGCYGVHNITKTDVPLSKMMELDTSVDGGDAAGRRHMFILEFGVIPLARGVVVYDVSLLCWNITHGDASEGEGADEEYHHPAEVIVNEIASASGFSVAAPWELAKNNPQTHISHPNLHGVLSCKLQQRLVAHESMSFKDFHALVFDYLMSIYAQMCSANQDNGSALPDLEGLHLLADQLVVRRMCAACVRDESLLIGLECLNSLPGKCYRLNGGGLEMQTLRSIAQLRYSNHICIELIPLAIPKAKTIEEEKASVSPAASVHKGDKLRNKGAYSSVATPSHVNTVALPQTSVLEVRNGALKMWVMMANAELVDINQGVYTLTPIVKSLQEVWIRAGTEPLIGHFLMVCCKYLNSMRSNDGATTDGTTLIGNSDIRLFTYNRSKYTWSELMTPCLQKYSSGTANPGAKPKNNQGLYILKPPYSMEEGDVFCVVNYTQFLENIKQSANVSNGTLGGIKIAVDRPVDKQFRSNLEDGIDIYSSKISVQLGKKKGKITQISGRSYTHLPKKNKKIMNRPEIALKIGGDYDFSSGDEEETGDV